jgi:hypothetical protein
MSHALLMEEVKTHRGPYRTKLQLRCELCDAVFADEATAETADVCEFAHSSTVDEGGLTVSWLEGERTGLWTDPYDGVEREACWTEPGRPGWWIGRAPRRRYDDQDVYVTKLEAQMEQTKLAAALARIDALSKRVEAAKLCYWNVVIERDDARRELSEALMLVEMNQSFVEYAKRMSAGLDED